MKYTFLLSVLSVGMFAGMAQAQDNQLVIISASAHETAMRGVGAANGVDTLAPFEETNGVRIIINAVPSGEVQDALPRLGTLNRSVEDLIFVSQGTANPRIAAFLEPLDDYLSTKPIKGFPDNWINAPVKAGTINGKHYLLPLRCGVFIMWNNTQFMAERGIAAPPKTAEELYEAAKRGTFEKPNGEKVFGFGVRGIMNQLPGTLATFAAMFGGQIVSDTGEVVVNSPAVVEGVNLLRRMYVEGLMPPNWSTVDVDQLFTDGRLTMVMAPDSNGTRYLSGGNLAADNIRPSHIPLAEAARTGERDYSASNMFYWGVGILKGSTDKDMAYDLLRHLASAKVEQQMIVNGNAPCTYSTLAKMGETNPATAVGADTLAISAAPLPGHPRLGQATDQLGKAVQEIVINGAPVQETLDRLAAELRETLN
ncbi:MULTISPECIES: extracellular solute-binding protein [unclassified Chelatococcus]|uniref:ABC transporter substrate-binding protein n=1 Tax=unclassified Chelatococcus TaxID=2638111 RepID=UPI001BCC7D64|nr:MULTISPECIES: extracellular solute-binding protein [unclassified Chelatococcus]MBS7701614.1 extracellular solute-binding protein [Chelatococcus sp. YT9]MBX3559684.1 extracellular solute-binding protein [Chelatococcus sp.]